MEIVRLLKENNVMLKFYDLSMNFIREYPSIAEVARDLYLSQSNIVNCCNGGY